MNLKPVFTFGGCQPETLAGITALHEIYYSSAWGFSEIFRAKVATELSAFCGSFDPSRDFQLNAFIEDRLTGSISLDVTNGGLLGAHLRWFIVAEEARGTGLGKHLIKAAMTHCDLVSEGRCWLTTFVGLDAARKLYEEHGFELVEEKDVDQWSGGVREQLFKRNGPQ